MIPISVCIIAKNEEKRIDRCLSSLMPYGFEIVVVDTGSTDQTKLLASKYTDAIYDFVWINDFSAARNFSLQMASNNWILMLDCDEWIESIDIEELQYFMRKLSHAVGSVNRNNITGTPEVPGRSIDRTERFFSRKRYHYAGIIHEQLTPKYGNNFECFLLNASIGHDGYCMTEEERFEKSERNVCLLLKQLDLQQDNPYIYYQLGKGYEMINDMEKASFYYGKGLEFDLDPELAYVQAMVVSYGHSLLSTAQAEQALLFENIYDEFSTSADFIYLMGIIYKSCGQYAKAIAEFRKATSFEFANTVGANSFLAYYQMGQIFMLIKEEEAAKHCFEKCGDFEPALRCLQSFTS